MIERNRSWGCTTIWSFLSLDSGFHTLLLILLSCTSNAVTSAVRAVIARSVHYVVVNEQLWSFRKRTLLLSVWTQIGLHCKRVMYTRRGSVERHLFPQCVWRGEIYVRRRVRKTSKNRDVRGRDRASNGLNGPCDSDLLTHVATASHQSICDWLKKREKWERSITTLTLLVVWKNQKVSMDIPLIAFEERIPQLNEQQERGLTRGVVLNNLSKTKTVVEHEEGWRGHCRTLEWVWWGDDIYLLNYSENKKAAERISEKGDERTKSVTVLRSISRHCGKIFKYEQWRCK